MSLLNLAQNPFVGKKVAIVGDIMLDTFIYGDAKRISPEAPVPVVRINQRQHMLGGAGNTAANIASIGATPLLVGRAGNDAHFKNFCHISSDLGIPTDHIISSYSPTICKTRVVAAGQQIVRIDEEDTPKLTADERRRLTDILTHVRQQADVVIVSDYNKGMIDQSTFDDIKTLWADGTILVDPKPRPTIDYTGASSMTPNIAEATALLGNHHEAYTDAHAAEVAKALYEKFSLSFSLFTRAGDGMTLYTGKKVHHFKPAHRLEVRDVSGAGDTVIATLASGIAAGLSLNDTIELANINGGLVVAKIGTATLTWDEIKHGISESEHYKQNS